jgi:hypothetical protein
MSVNLNNTTPAAPGGNSNVTWQKDTSGNVSGYLPTGAGGTVTSVALTAPAEFSVAGSPITGAGTLAISKATQNANQVWAGPASGSAAAPAFRALVPADGPAMVGDTGSGGSAGLVPAPPAGSAAASKFLKADGTFAVVPGAGGGTVTSVALTVPAEFSISGSPITGAGTLAVSKATQNANTFWRGPTSGSAAAPTFGAIVPADFVANIPIYVGSSLVGKPSVAQVVAFAALPINGQFAANFASSVGSVGTNPTATAVYTVLKNGASIGTISISTSGVFTFATSGGAAQSFSAGDRLTITAPSPVDTTLSDVSITLQAART